ncbi:MAG: peroxiredoxin [Dokdonella sp.]
MSPAATVSIDHRVPALSGVSDEGRVSLTDLHGKAVVVYFYPKDNTPGCTTEAQDFRDLYAEFVAKDCTILGVSRDSAASHAKFRAKHELPFALIADTDETWCRTFDVIHEKMLYGKAHLGIVRSTFLIDRDGVLRAEWRKVKVKGHAAEVLERVATL